MIKFSQNICHSQFLKITKTYFHATHLQYLFSIPIYQHIIKIEPLQNWNNEPFHTTTQQEVVKWVTPCPHLIAKPAIRPLEVGLTGNPLRLQRMERARDTRAWICTKNEWGRWWWGEKGIQEETGHCKIKHERQVKERGRIEERFCINLPTFTNAKAS